MIIFRHGVTEFGNITLECEGHAGYAKMGKDIVCAGASALCMAAEAALASYDRRATIETGDGYFMIRCKYTPETAAAARTVIVGMAAIAELYPAYLSCENLRKNNQAKKK